MKNDFVLHIYFVSVSPAGIDIDRKLFCVHYVYLNNDFVLHISLFSVLSLLYIFVKRFGLAGAVVVLNDLDVNSFKDLSAMKLNVYGIKFFCHCFER